MNWRTSIRSKHSLIFAAIIILICFGTVKAVVPNGQEGPGTDSGAQQEFQKIVTGIRSMGSTMPPAEMAVFAEKKLLEFIEKYPETPEAMQAKIGIGQIYSSVGDNEKAIAQFKMLLEKETAMSEEDRKAAQWFLASAYLDNEDFNKAEVLLREIEGRAGAADAKLASAAKENLERIKTLKMLANGSPAPQFPGTAKDISGKKISLKDFKGKVVLLDFWATWCKPCLNEMPNVIGIYNEYHKEGFEIVGISLDKDIETLKSYIKENNISWRQMFGGGWKNNYAKIYAVQSIPSTFLIGRDGKIREKQLRGEALEEAVKKLVKEK